MNKLVTTRRSLLLAAPAILLASSALARFPRGIGALPSGVTDDWDAANYVASPRPTIKNSITNGTTDANLLTGSRRVFNSLNWKLGSPQTTTDNNALAPDGSMEATTIVASSGVDWDARLDPTTFTYALPAGTYTFAVSVRNAGAGTAQFRMSVSTALVTKTATGSWQRFTDTFVHAGGSITIHSLRALAGLSTAANFEIVDAELFAGSSDLNPLPLSAKPLAVQNRDIILGFNAFDPGISVSGGEWATGAPGLIPLTASEAPTAFTVAYVVKPSAANFTATRAMLASVGAGYKKFSMGFSSQGGDFSDVDGGGGGPFYNDTQIGGIDNASEITSTGGLPQIGYGYCVVIQSYDGTKSDWWLNGIKIGSQTVSVAAPAGFTDLSVGGLWTSQAIWGGSSSASWFYESGFTRRRIVRWNRKLSDVEALQAYTVLSSGLTTGKRLVASMGDSELGRAYTDGGVFNATKKYCSINTHANATTIANHQVPPLSTFMDGMLSGQTAWNEYVLLMFIATNNLTTAPNTVSNVLAQYAAYIDDRRSAMAALGRTTKVVAVTLLPRLAASDPTKPQFDADRAGFNAGLVAGLTGRINALVRIDLDPTYGPDAASDNLTLFPDNTHPASAGFKPVIVPLITAALNSL